MQTLKRRSGLVLALSAAVAVFAAGCGQSDRQAASDGNKKVGQQVQKKEEVTRHDSWWCEEHGIPEAECSMCSKKLERECKAKGDWCYKHNRAKSQCFKCDPKLKEVFAAKYRAHYNGKEPPPISDD